MFEEPLGGLIHSKTAPNGGRVESYRKSSWRVVSGCLGLALGGPWDRRCAIQAQHPVHRLRRHRLRRPRSLRRRRRPRHADAQHRQDGRRRHDLLLVLRPAELHARTRRDADRAHPEPQRHDDRGLPGPGRRPAGGRMDARLGAQTGRLPDLLHRQVAPGRGRLRAAQRAGLRRDEVRRPVPPQRLHLRRPDLVPRHGPGAAGDVPEGDERRRCRARPARSRTRTSRSTASTSTSRARTSRCTA